MRRYQQRFFWRKPIALCEHRRIHPTPRQNARPMMLPTPDKTSAKPSIWRAAIEDARITHLHSPWASKRRAGRAGSSGGWRACHIACRAQRFFRRPSNRQASRHALAEKFRARARFILTNAQFNPRHYRTLHGGRRAMCRFHVVYEGLDLTQVISHRDRACTTQPPAYLGGGTLD